MLIFHTLETCILFSIPMQTEIIAKTEKYVKDELEWLCAAHDFYHIERVLKLARSIYSLEKRGDLLVIELGALLHESFDEKFYSKDEIEQKEGSLRAFLQEQWLDEERLQKTFFVIKNVGFGKSLSRGADFPMTPELEIVEDADRIDAIWAIAIARTFSYGGKNKRPIYDPTIPLVDLQDQESYRKGTPSSFHHFFEKLLKLKDLLHTQSAKKIALSRHEFMEQYVAAFLSEWNGDDVEENSDDSNSLSS